MQKETKKSKTSRKFSSFKTLLIQNTPNIKLVLEKSGAMRLYNEYQIYSTAIWEFMTDKAKNRQEVEKSHQSHVERQWCQTKWKW